MVCGSLASKFGPLEVAIATAVAAGLGGIAPVTVRVGSARRRSAVEVAAGAAAGVVLVGLWAGPHAARSITPATTQRAMPCILMLIGFLPVEMSQPVDFLPILVSIVARNQYTLL